jgi:hypothetical protein
MTQQDKQIRVGARECFAYNGLLPNGNKYEVDSKTFIKVESPLFILNIVPSQV